MNFLHINPKPFCIILVLGFWVICLEHQETLGQTPTSQRSGKSRSFLFTYGAEVKDLKPGTMARLWLPLPVTTGEQKVEMVAHDFPGKIQIGKESMYGNQMIFLEAQANPEGRIPVQVTFRITRWEVKSDRSGQLIFKPSPEEKIARFLQPDALVPLEGKPQDWIRGKKLPADQFASAKILYDMVNDHMVYKKEGTEWGRGDAVWACDSKFGNCSDFHSLFISLARSQKIPSKFEMGFPLPPKKGEGTIGGYHCWAWFLPEGKGWIPVDISEAKRNPELREYYFGNLTEDRVQFTTGRDIELVPKQSGPALNFFIYPYVEVNGQPYPGEKIEKKFTYKDLP